jgi:hypothetical protein
MSAPSRNGCQSDFLHEGAEFFLYWDAQRSGHILTSMKNFRSFLVLLKTVSEFWDRYGDKIRRIVIDVIVLVHLVIDGIRTL